MATGLSQSRRQLALDWLFNTQSTTQPNGLWVSLHTGDPGDTGGTSNEASAGSYARYSMPASPQGTNWNTTTAANPSVLTNKTAVTFPTATAQWAGGAAITFFAIWDASTSGNMVCRGSVTPATNVINTGNTPSFAAGQLSISIAPT